MRRSVTVFPDLAAKEVSAIVETRKQYAKAFNMSVDCLVTNNSTSKRFLHKVQYERIKEECPTLPTGLIQCARDVAVEAVKAWNVKRTKLKRKHPKKAERMRRPSMKEKCTMRYDVRTVTLRGSQLNFSTCDRRVKAIISIPGFFTERYPDSEGWKLKGANMGIDRKGRVFVNLIYECPDYDTVENDGRIVGLDRGVYNIVTTSDGTHYGAEDARRVKRKYNHVRSELQEKGTRSAKRRLVSISGCEKRFVHDRNHCISKKLANIDEDVSVYVLEDLSSMNMLRLRGKSSKTMRKWLSNWSYSDLEFKLAYKCKRNGIRVEFVDARYTSQKCSVCKTIDKTSRKGNRYVCRKCGNTMHADVNAAINIRDNYITRVQQSGQAAVNQPYGWGATGKPETEPVGKTLTSKPSGLS
ncbi:MAG: transposase [Spirochaetes bacterium]|uniref:Transposase n=1 Tax=Candidatus Aphodenecus pullistercoris TaxID=2840669 RepID=A0A9D9H9E7_9SPIR|nr:transposase [Candidatus Aphodenecus pullistercoris]